MSFWRLIFAHRRERLNSRNIGFPKGKHYFWSCVLNLKGIFAPPGARREVFGSILSLLLDPRPVMCNSALEQRY